MPGAPAGQHVDSQKMSELTDDNVMAGFTHVLSHMFPHPVAQTHVNLLYHA